MKLEQNEIACHGGAFTLPDEVFRYLKEASTSGLVYLRHDEDTVVISPVPIPDGRRRQINRQYRADIFRNATRLKVMEMGETIRLMAVHWRPVRENP